FISYPQTARWLVDHVNAALASGNSSTMGTLATQLDGWNSYEANLTPPSVPAALLSDPPPPASTDPAPVDPAPVDPAPVDPTPVTYAALTLDGATGKGAATLTAPALATVTAAAISTWVAAGASATTLAGLTFVITDLPAGQLSQTIGTTVYLDADAAGYGWYAHTSSAPFQNKKGILGARNSTAAAGHVDLLTVLLHELGNVLGVTSGSGVADDVMLASLQVGIRRVLPTGLTQ
ncbi:MAG: hypothetical protein ABIZ07_06935, partial [Dermatophilaceae bacterium]